jgi:hypothetical protein
MRKPDDVILSREIYDDLRMRAEDGDLLRHAAEAWKADGQDLRADLLAVIERYKNMRELSAFLSRQQEGTDFVPNTENPAS